MAKMNKPVENRLKCSFCGKSQDQVAKLIAGPGVYMCNECVGLCNDILDEEGPKDRSLKIRELQSAGPKKHERPHPLKSVPTELVETATKSIQTLIEAYDDAGKRVWAEPLYRVLLVMQENEFGSQDIRLLPVLEQLHMLYDQNDQYQSCLQTLEWMISIVEETKREEPDRIELLIKQAKLYIRLNQGKLAEAVLDRVLGQTPG